MFHVVTLASKSKIPFIFHDNRVEKHHGWLRMAVIFAPLDFEIPRKVLFVRFSA